MSTYIVVYNLSNKNSSTYQTRYNNLITYPDVIYRHDEVSTLICESDKNIDEFSDEIMNQCQLLLSDDIFISEMKDSPSMIYYGKIKK